MRHYYIFGLCFFLLSSCETDTNLDYYVENLSSTEIHVLGKNIIRASEIDTKIEVNSRTNIASWYKRGKQTDPFEPKSVLGEELIIINANGDTAKTDFSLMSNWTYDIKERGASANHQYHLSITDVDF